MTTIQISEIKVGSGLLSVANHRNRAEAASTLIITYANSLQTFIHNTSYNKEIVIGGTPLSASLFYDPGLNPSAGDTVGIYYALDIIKNNNIEDGKPDDPSVPTTETVNMVLNGNRLSTAKINNLYYFAVIESSATKSPFNPIIFMGMPMATNSYNELFINDSGYSLNNIQEQIEVRIGGVPLHVGRIENKYYLIIKTINEKDS